MEDARTETAFHWIISAPGLSHIAERIFMLLDAKSLITCSEVCSSWKWYIIDNRMLRKNILNKNRDNLLCDSSAPKHSHNRLLLKKLLGSNFEVDNDKLDNEEEFDAFKLFVTLVDPKQIESRLSCGQLPKVKVHSVCIYDLGFNIDS